MICTSRSNEYPCPSSSSKFNHKEFFVLTPHFSIVTTHEKIPLGLNLHSNHRYSIPRQWDDTDSYLSNKLNGSDVHFSAIEDQCNIGNCKNSIFLFITVPLGIMVLVLVPVLVTYCNTNLQKYLFCVHWSFI